MSEAHRGTILPFRGVYPKIHPSAFIAETATVIGDVEIGADSSIWYGCVLRGDVHHIRIGAGVNIQDGTVVHVAGDMYPTLIGDRVTVGHMALIHACTLEDDAFVGMKACVMDGSVVKAWGMVAAGGLVTPGKTVGSGELWAGSPAKYWRDLGEDDRRVMRSTADHYAGLARDYWTHTANTAPNPIYRKA